MARPKKEKSEYTAKIKVLGQTYEATGNTAAEAIGNLKPLGTVRGVALLTVSSGLSKQDKVLLPMQTMALFSPSKLTRELMLKNISMRFGI